MVKNDTKIQKYAHQPHILVVDDDRRIRDLLTRYLSEHGFIVIAAEDAAMAERIMERFSFDLIVLDVMMPGEDGFSFAGRLRGQGQEIPVLLLTALGESSDRISGLEAGADDYLVKPFEPKELLLRLNAILKRSLKIEEGVKSLRIGEWVYDPEAQMLRSDAEDVSLTNAEVLLLNALAQGDGDVVSRDALAQACGLDAGERTVDVQVTRLRRKIEVDTKNPRYLQTVRGKGYRLRAEVIK